MTPTQIHLVRQSWAALEPTGPGLATVIYTRLLDQEAGFAAMFVPAGMDRQARRFAETLSLLVESLEDPDAFVPVLAALGRSHMALGVTERHYRLFGRVLLVTLGESLPSQWSPELHDAWADAYLLYTSIMKRAGARASGRHPEVTA